MNQKLESWNLIRKLLFILIMDKVIKSKRPIETLPIELRQFIYRGQRLYLFMHRKEDLVVFRSVLAELIRDVTMKIKLESSINKKETLF